MISRRSTTLTIGMAVTTGLLRSPHALADAERLAAVAEACRRIERGIGGRLGVAVLNTATGARAGHRTDERFPLLSTFKVIACAALLKRVDDGRDGLDRRVRYGPGDLVPYSPVTGKQVDQGMTLAELCEAAMTASDNTAANLVLQAIEGPEGLTRFARAIGDPVTRLDRWEVALNEAAPGDPRDTTSPAAMADTLAKLVLGDVLTAASRARLAGWLVANRTGDARIRAGLPQGWRVGDRTGTGDNGTANDIAVAWPPGRAPIVLCVYLTQTKASLDARNGAIADVARAVAAALA